MIFKYELRFVVFTWPNLCLWVAILCPALKTKNVFKNCKKKPRFVPALIRGSVRFRFIFQDV